MTSILMLTFLVQFSGVRDAYAQDPPVWRPTQGPPGGSIYALANLQSNTLLAGSNRGVYLSLNDGLTWTPRSEGFIADSVFALVVTPAGSIIAATNQGLYRSVDTGLSWTTLDTGPGITSIKALTQGNGTVYAGGPLGVISSTDNGETWEIINDGLLDPRISSLAFTQEGNVLAGTMEGIFHLTPFSNGWIESNTGLNQFADREINTIRQLDSRRLIIGTANGIYFSDADSIAWNPFINQPDGEDSQHVIALEVDEQGTIYAASPRTVYRSPDEGVTWISMNRELPEISSPLDIVHTIHLAGNGDLLAGTNQYGIFRYIEAIEQWEPSTSGLSTQTVSSMVLNTFGALLTGTKSGLFITEDQGTTWDHVVLTPDLSGFTLFFQDIEGEGRIFASASSLLISDDNGATWRSIFSRKVDAFYPMRNGTYIAYAQETNSIHLSDTEGELWLEVGSPLPDAPGSAIYEFIQDEQGRLLAGTTEGLLRLEEDWELVDLSVDADTVRALAKDVMGRTYVAEGQVLYRSDESGDNWTPLLTADSPIVDILPGTLVVTSHDGMYRSVDDGRTWQTLNSGLPQPAELITAVIDNITIADALNAYLSINNAGVYQGTGVIFLSSEESIPALGLAVSAYPVPFLSSVTIQYTVDRHQYIQVIVYDVLGRKMGTLADEYVYGTQQIHWNAPDRAPGLYLVHIKTDTQHIIKPILKAAK